MAIRVKNKPTVKKRRWWLIILVSLFCVSILISLIPEVPEKGNVARIKIEGAIMGSGDSSPFASSVASSQTITHYIQEAESNPFVKVILLEINSPGGSAVASDEVASAVLSAQKPTVAVIREVGASGAYWVASATNHVIANRMSITGSIGVISSYLEFSGLMDTYGVTYQRLVAGDKKDLGVPFKELSVSEEAILQQKLDTIHDYFIEAVAKNRNLAVQDTRKIATGEFYLGVEALELGLVDELGSLSDAEKYIQNTYGVDKIEYITYQQEASILDILGSLSSSFSYAVGEGIGSTLFNTKTNTISLR